MGFKLNALLAVVVVAAAGAGAYYFFFMDHSDYTLLDSEDNIKAGLTIESDMKSPDDDMKGKYVVKSVEDTKVTFSYDSTSEGTSDDVYELSDFKPSLMDFDYTGDAPSGVTVVKDGNVYTINGKYTSSIATYTYDNLKITYDGSSVTAVSGWWHTKYTSDSSERQVDLSTNDGKVIANFKYTGSGTQEIAKSNFFKAMFISYDASDYYGADIKESKENIGGVNATVYTINGTDSHGDSYDNLKIYTYKGLMIKGDGKINGEKVTLKTSIYMD